MKKLILSLLVVLLTSSTLVTASATSALNPSTLSAVSPVNPALATALTQTKPNQMVNVIIYLKDQLNPKTVTGTSRAHRLQNLVQALHNKADTTQVNLRNLLATRKGQSLVSAFTPLWIQNAVAATVANQFVSELAKQPEISLIVPESTFQAPARPATTAQITSVAPNIDLINAPALWNAGYRGQGIVVANLDTGVDYTHPDLSSSWRGGTNSWFDPYNQHSSYPVDVNGHGTWTTSVIVGGSSSGQAIGVAPEAKWIAAKIFNDSGVSTSTAIHQAYQWVLDPDHNPATADAPQVVNNSWTYGSIGCNLEFEPDLAALVSAGITPVFAAGNFGPGDSSGASPANNPSAFAVGYTDNNSQIASSSSRGPTSCGGSSRTYPALVAPGTNVPVADLYSSYYTASGTSLASPHVAGAAALLLSTYPYLNVGQVETALTTGAFDLGTAGADNTFGAGRLDVLAAYNSLVATSPLTPTATAAPTATPTPTATPGPSGAIFSDGFESGNFNNWSSSRTDGGRLSVTSGAALKGQYGLKALINNTNPIYVINTTPNAESSYHARFYFSPNGVTLATSTQDIFSGRSGSGVALFNVQLRNNSGSYQVRGVVLLNNGSTQTTSWHNVTNASHAIEIAWQAASTSTNTTGSFSLYLDGKLAQTKSNLANGTYRLEDVLLGPSNGLTRSVSGTEYYDAFVSNRSTYIGL